MSFRNDHKFKITRLLLKVVPPTVAVEYLDRTLRVQAEGTPTRQKLRAKLIPLTLDDLKAGSGEQIAERLVQRFPILHHVKITQLASLVSRLIQNAAVAEFFRSLQLAELFPLGTRKRLISEALHSLPSTALSTVLEYALDFRWASASKDGSVKLWRGNAQTANASSAAAAVTAGAKLCETTVQLSQVGSVVHCLLPLPRQRVATAVESGAIEVMSTFSGKRLHILHGHLGPVNSICCVTHPAGGVVLVSSGDDKTLRVWHLDEGVELATVSDAHGDDEGPVTALIALPDESGNAGGSGVFVSASQSLRLWKLNADSLSDPPVCLAVLSDRQLPLDNLSVSAAVGATRVGQLADIDCACLLAVVVKGNAANSSVLSTAWLVATGSRHEEVIRLWYFDAEQAVSAMQPHCVARIAMPRGSIGSTALAMHADGRLLVGAVSRALLVYSTAACNQSQPDEKTRHRRTESNEAPSVHSGQSFLIMDTPPALQRTLKQPGNMLALISLPSGRVVVACDEREPSRQLQLWNLEKGVAEQHFLQGLGSGSSGSFSAVARSQSADRGAMHLQPVTALALAGVAED